jgi:putative NIF3 family GTP cyclohydrolase 1 type 2
VEDPVQKAKNEFIAQNGLVVFRLRDHWRARKENDMATGLADSLGWASRRVPGDMAMYDIPSATLSDTVSAIRKKLGVRGGLRAVGDPKSKVKRVMLYPGAMDVTVIWKYFDQVDLIVAGEVREWECVPYAEDMNGAAEKRSLVTVGRVASEDPGMKACAAWLKTVVKGVPVQWISAGDPYWRAV